MLINVSELFSSIVVKPYYTKITIETANEILPYKAMMKMTYTNWETHEMKQRHSKSTYFVSAIQLKKMSTLVAEMDECRMRKYLVISSVLSKK